MKKLTKFWTILEIMPNVSAVKTGWEYHVADEFNLVASLFRPTDKRAKSYPCPYRGQTGCSREVRDYIGDEIVAICDSDMFECDDIVLTLSDIILHEMDFQRMAQELCSTFGFSLDCEMVPGIETTAKVGYYQPSPGKRVPVFLTVQWQYVVFNQVIHYLSATLQTPFILLAPTSRFADELLQSMLMRVQGFFYALEDLTVAGEQTMFTAAEPPEQIFSAVHQAVVPADAKDTVTFPTPQEATWEDFTFEFIAKEVFNARCRGVDTVKRIEPDDLGMRNRKNGRPTLQWTLLHSLAKTSGVLSLKSPQELSKIKKQKHLLAKKLKSFFQLNDDPIIWNSYDRHWTAKFLVRPD
ncbi:hypothetical protein ACQZV8_07480 [Magnetococcales bacterium HHB-1]